MINKKVGSFIARSSLSINPTCPVFEAHFRRFIQKS